VVFHILSFTGTVGPVCIAATATFFDGGVFGDFAMSWMWTCRSASAQYATSSARPCC
jgi:hypothetical protein